MRTEFCQGRTPPFPRPSRILCCVQRRRDVVFDRHGSATRWQRQRCWSACYGCRSAGLLRLILRRITNLTRYGDARRTGETSRRRRVRGGHHRLRTEAADSRPSNIAAESLYAQEASDSSSLRPAIGLDDHNRIFNERTSRMADTSNLSRASPPPEFAGRRKT